MFIANRRKNVSDIYFVTRHVVIADWVFTTPAIIIQLASGMGLVTLGGHIVTDFWLITALILFFFAGACWLPVIWLQIKMRDMAKQAFDMHIHFLIAIGNMTAGGYFLVC